jgi:hypothetical protein
MILDSIWGLLVDYNDRGAIAEVMNEARMKLEANNAKSLAYRSLSH